MEVDLEKWVWPTREDTDRAVTHRMIALSAVLIAGVLVTRSPATLQALSQLLLLALAIPLCTHILAFTERVGAQRRARKWRDESSDQ